jgi:hypothetical protein
VTKDLGAYDMILGRDLLTDLGIDIRFSTNTVEWDDSEIPMKGTDLEMQESYHIGDGDVADDALERIKRILDALYKPANLREVAKEANHLPEEQQEELHTLLHKYEDLFDGTLGHWNDVKLKVELKPDVTP